MKVNKIIVRNVLVPVLLLTAINISKAQQEMPDAIKNHIMQGIAAFEASKTPADIDKALLEFNEAARIAPDYPDVHYYLGKTYALLQGNAGRAVKELKKYLELYPDAEDKAEINNEIARLNKVIESKRKSELVGIELMSLPDGIFVRSAQTIVQGGRVTSRGVGLKAGDKLVKVKDTKVKDMTLDEVFKLIDEDTVTRIMPITVLRGGTEYNAVFERFFRTKISGTRDLGEEDLNEVVAGSKVPVVAVFWKETDEICKKYIPDLRTLSYNCKSSIQIITVSVDYNLIISSEFNVKEIPTILIFNGGKVIKEIAGYNPEELKKEIKPFCNPGEK